MTDSFFDGIDDRMDAKSEEEEAARNSDDWNPEAGDQLNCILLKVNVRKTKFGPAAVLIVRNVGPESGGIENEGTCTVWCSRTTLIGGLISEAPKIGSGLAIRFDGQASTQDGTGKYYAYTVVGEDVDRRLWDDIEQHLDTSRRRKKQEKSSGEETTYF